MGNRERLQIDQAVHGHDDVEKFRVAVLLLRLRVPIVLDLASGRSAHASRVE